MTQEQETREQSIERLVTGEDSDLAIMVAFVANDDYRTQYWPIGVMLKEKIDRTFAKSELRKLAELAYSAGERAGRISGMERCEKLAQHFAAGPLTKEEWPKHGLCERAGRFDNGAIGITSENIAAAIRQLISQAREE